MQPLEKTWRQFWIFQANPDVYDARSELIIGQEVNWYVSRFIDRYQPGDIVYLWISGDEAGIYGWAEVETEAFLDDEGKQRITTAYRGVLRNPVLKSDMTALPGAFDGLTILRNAQGTNFRVTVLEAIELNRLIGADGGSPPPDPDEVEDPNSAGEMYSKAAYVLDYRFDNDVKSIVASCLNTSQNLNRTFFPTLLIDTTFRYFGSLMQQDPPNAFSALLERVVPLGELGSASRFTELIEIVRGARLAPELADGVMVKRNTLKILASARRFAIKTTGRERILARHLVGAIFHGPTESMQRYLQELALEQYSLSLEQVRESFVGEVEKAWPDDRMPAWRALISEELGDSADSADFIPLLTKIDSDSADEFGRDLLDIDDDAIALAKILCAKDASPPLAIGLFGEWGSGKTFFMRRIQRHVKSLSDRIRQSDQGSNGAYHAKVAQIWFNAWNYQDGTLWASLVNHVFAGLKRELKRLNRDGADEQFIELMERLDEDREIERNLEQYSKQVRDLTQEKADITDRISFLKSANDELEKDQPFAAKEFLGLEKLKDYGEDIERFFAIEGAQEALENLSENAGTVNELIAAFAKFNLSSKIKLWRKFISRSRKRIVIFVCCLGSIIAIGFLIQHFFQNVTWGVSSSAITTALLAISARFSRFGEFLNLVAKVKRDIEVESGRRANLVREKREQYRKQLGQLEIRLQETERSIDESEKKLNEYNARYGTPSDETFANFVFARADSTDYKSQLGLLNTIRRDFSRLNELLVEQNDKKLPKLDRIILYIDDLDRCEPEIVVDVLQAIHLMLAFPLFMVVVGVDARWLGRSLKKRYSFLVHEGTQRNDDSADYHAASTHDYLEKIFQIPFWLKRLDGDRANDMMKALLTPEESPDKVAASGEQKDDLPGKPGAEPRATEPGFADESGLFDETEDQDENFEESIDPNEILINNLVSTRSLEMSEPELLFFQKLGKIVGRSPRAIKRFINLYRILKASHRKARIAGFSEANGGFEVPLFLLAVVCGSPKDTDELFSHLASSSEAGTLEDALDQRRESDTFFRRFNGTEEEAEIRKMLQKLIKAGEVPEDLKKRQEDELVSAIRNFQTEGRDSAGWQALCRSLDETMDEIGGLEIAEIRGWIPDVARFSYREWIG